jgi:hypothetical protein
MLIAERTCGNFPSLLIDSLSLIKLRQGSRRILENSAERLWVIICFGSHARTELDNEASPSEANHSYKTNGLINRFGNYNRRSLPVDETEYRTR